MRGLILSRTFSALFSAFLLSSALCANTIEDANKAFQAQKYTEALTIYKTLCDTPKSGEKPDAKACSALGYIYQSGKGVKANLDESSKYYKKACDNGDKESCANAGWN